MILAARVKRAGYVTMGHQQLRVLALAQRRQQAIFTGAGGAHQPNQFSALKDPLSLAPDMVDLDMFAATVRQHQVGAFSLGDDAAIVKAQRLRRMLTDQTDRLWQGEGIVLGVGDAESGIQQAGGVIVR